MPKKYGILEKDIVVAHLVGQVLTGQLRSGDRIDRNKLAADVGVSRVPVQEAMVQLERDGIISTRYHRGVFLERFDEATVREHCEIYGLLNAMAAERAAGDADGRILDRLESLLEALHAAVDSQSFIETARDYRGLVASEYAGPQLAALISASRCFLPQPSWVSSQRVRDAVLPFYEAETAALRERNPGAARAVNIERSTAIADIIVDELTTTGVFGAPPPA